MMQTKQIKLLCGLTATTLLVTGCNTPTANAVAAIVKANADSRAHVKIEVDIPPNQITYERWVSETNNAAH